MDLTLQDRAVINSETPVVVDFLMHSESWFRESLGYGLFRYLFIERLLCLSTLFDTSMMDSGSQKVRYN